MINNRGQALHGEMGSRAGTKRHAAVALRQGVRGGTASVRREEDINKETDAGVNSRKNAAQHSNSMAGLK